MTGIVEGRVDLVEWFAHQNVIVTYPEPEPIQISSKAVRIIEEVIRPLLNGCRIDRLKLVVSPESQIAAVGVVQTAFGTLKVEPNANVRKGLSYVIEDPGRVGRGFAWVSGKK